MAETLYYIAIGAVPFILAVTLHEVAHGWIAWKLGDATARLQGRLTINPIRHIDPFGTIILPATLLLLRLITGFGILIGYAKPVPVDMRNFRQPLLDMALVAAAGPASNLLMALFWASFIKVSLVLFGDSGFVGHLVLFGDIGVFINLLLLVINLIPLLPLDGGRMIVGIVPKQLALILMRLEPFGFFILIFLLLASPLGGFLIKMLLFYQTQLMRLFELNYHPVILRLLGS